LEAEATKNAAEAAALGNQREAFAAEVAAFREQTALLQRQLQTDRGRFSGEHEAVEKGLSERADDLQTQQADFDRQVATWEATRQQQERQLAERVKRLEAEAEKIAAQAADLETQRATFATETAKVREQTAQQQRHLEADQTRLAGELEAVEKKLSERSDALQTQQADFRHQVMTWETMRQQEESRLVERGRCLETEAAKIAAQAARLETQWATGEAKRIEEANALRVQQEELSRQATTREGIRQQEASHLAEEARQLDAEGAENAARTAALASQLAAMQQGLAGEADLAPRQTDDAGQIEGLVTTETGRDQPPDDDDPLAVIRRTWQQEVDKDRYGPFRTRFVLFAAATACLAVIGAFIWWNYLL
jgi:hypothetical protein